MIVYLQLLGQENYKTVIDAIIDLAKKAAKDPWIINEKNPEIQNLEKKLVEDYKNEFEKAYKIQEKQARSNELDKIRNLILENNISETIPTVVVGDII